MTAPKCIKCNTSAKHDPVDGVMTTCGRHSAAHAERAAELMRKRNADSDHNPLVMLTTQERADYDTFKRNGYSRDDAFRAIGRADLIRPEAAE